MIKSKKPKVQNKVFSPSWPADGQNVVLNFMGNPEFEFGAYAEAFHEAGKLLINQMPKGGYSDLCACPIVFLYRHSIELYMKQIIITGNDLLVLSGKKPSIESFSSKMCAHKLMPLFPAVSKIIKSLTKEWSAIESHFEERLQDFDAIDPSSFAFRYPTKKDGSAVLQTHFVFSVRQFVDELDPVLDLFDDVVYELEVRWHDQTEATFESMSGDI